MLPEQCACCKGHAIGGDVLIYHLLKAY